MKKQLLFLFLIVFLGSVNAQKTISSVDFGKIGDTIIFTIDEFYVGEINTGEKGDQITWDFSFLADNNKDTLMIVNPNTTDGGQIGSSNLVLQNNLLDVYWENNSNELTIKALGFDFDFSIIDTLDSLRTVYIEYPEGIHQAEYLMEYEDVVNSEVKGFFNISVKDTFDFDSTSIYVDSVRITDDVTVLDSINGYGILQLPLDTFDCLRQEIHFKHEYSVEILVENPFFPFGPQYAWVPLSNFMAIGIPNVNEDYIRFWARGQQYPVLEFTMDTLMNSSNSTRYLRNSKDYIDGIKDKKGSLRIYPNPAIDYITLYMEINSEVTIYNTLGKEVRDLTLNSKNIQISISDLEKGIYFVRVESKNKIETLKFIKE